jgi:hypothetical protein
MGVTITTTGQPKPDGDDRVSEIPFASRRVRLGTYTKIGEWPFLGTARVGSPTKIECVCGVDGATSLDVRIYDVNNNQVICEALGVTAAWPQVVDLGAISNLPLLVSIWELQARRAGGTGAQEILASSLVLSYGHSH